MTTVQCKGITATGERCHRFVTLPRQYCWQHITQLAERPFIQTTQEAIQSGNAPVRARSPPRSPVSTRLPLRSPSPSSELQTSGFMTPEEFRYVGNIADGRRRRRL